MASDMATKVKIARQFSRAASHYDDIAAVQWDIAQDALAGMPSGLDRILDIGAGTGRITQLLNKHGRNVFGLDLAEGMVNFARSQEKPHATIHWLVGDAEQLPFANASIDGVFSSMALQWCSPMAQVMAEMARVLKPKGVARLAILVDGSLHELGQSWRQVDQRMSDGNVESTGTSHLNPYPTAASLAKDAINAGFDVKQELRRYTTWHPKLTALLASIRDIGANTRTHNAPATSFNRQVLQWLQEAYSDFANDGGQLPLSYQVCHLTLSRVDS